MSKGAPVDVEKEVAELLGKVEISDVRKKVASTLKLEDPLKGPDLLSDEKELNSLLDTYFGSVRRAATAVRVDENAWLAKCALLELFSKDALIVVGQNVVARGHDAILQFYDRNVLAEENFWPRPVEDSRVCDPERKAIIVDIFLHSKTRTRLVRDTFTYMDHKICHMHIDVLTDHFGRT